MSDVIRGQDNYNRSQRTKISVPLRPLTKGIIRNVSPTMLPIGAMYDVQGFIPSTSGLSRRGGIDHLTTIDPLDVSRYDYMDSFINDDGSKTTYTIADGKFYELAGPTFVERPCEYRADDELPSVATISALVDTVAVTGIDTKFASAGLNIGDILIVDPGGAEEKEYTIDTVSTDLSLSVLELITPAFTTKSFTIKRLLYPAPEWQITVRRIDRVLYICLNQFRLTSQQ